MSVYFNDGSAADEDKLRIRGDPAIPQSHPIIRRKLVEWKAAALRNLENHDHDDFNGIKHFARHLRHISFLELKLALAKCFSRLYTEFPEDAYTFALNNTTEYNTDKQSGNSEAWMGDIVGSEGLIAEEERQEMDDRQLVKVFVEDAVYSGGSLASTYQDPTKCPDVYIVPYVKDLTEIAELVRVPKQLVFMNARSSEITEIVRTRQRGGRDILTFEPISRGDIGESSIVLYFEELIGVPFYFDHKLADFNSWGSSLWMFAGFHCDPAKDEKVARTNFIAGCENDDVKPDSSRYRCPVPPY